MSRVVALPRARFLVLAVGAALALRLLPATVHFVIGTDEALYLTLARNLAAGRGFTADGRTPETEFAPGYPFFAAAFYALGSGPDLPARINIVLFGPLLVLPAYGLARRLAGEGPARLAALLVAGLPALVLSVPNFEAPTEQLYMLCLWGGWLCLYRALDAGTPADALAAGALLGLAHVTRIEGLLFVGLGAALLLIVPWRQARRPAAWLRLAAFLAAAALFVVPYAVFIHAHTGLWLAPKAVLHQYHGEALRSSDPLAFEAAYADYEYNRQHLRELPGMLAYLWQNRDLVPGFYARNLLAEARQAATALSFLLVLWLPWAAWGVVRLWRQRAGPAKLAFLATPLLPALIYPLSVVDPRYLLPLLPGALVLAALGLQGLPALAGRWRGLGWFLAVALAAAVLAADVAGPFLIPRPVEYKALGEWMARNGVGQGEVLLARKRQVAFYAGAAWAWLPLTDTTGLRSAADDAGANYVVLDQRTAPSLRPQLAYLLDPRQAPSWLVPTKVLDLGPRIILYQVRR